jgi:uncharacterized membrane protein HdeD (DUF308 family)
VVIRESWFARVWSGNNRNRLAGYYSGRSCAALWRVCIAGWGCQYYRRLARAARALDLWAGLAVEGIAGIAAAATTVLWPAITAFVLVGIISAWALITGIFEIMAAIRLRREIRGEWLLALSGVLSVLFGLFVFFFPLAGALAIALTIGIYSLAFGVLFIALGFRLRARNRTSYASSPIGVPVR